MKCQIVIVLQAFMDIQISGLFVGQPLTRPLLNIGHVTHHSDIWQGSVHRRQ